MSVSLNNKHEIRMDQLLGILPQRYPMIMVDKVTYVDENKIIAIKNVSGNEPCFLGHFPNKKVFPGVLLTEAIAQASIVLLQQGTELRDGGTPVIYHTNIKFKHIVLPGDQLKIEVAFQKRVGNSAIVNASVFVENVLVASGSLTFTIATF
ncbi:3-hydroxyacyl-ACP dehydratase FabZ [Halalkalibacter alkalisediminis]|uniref:3-hydroxyacyl-ACP dehydratase FabZ n=1 Tax=Halalkalibacter alkalisediminis TaxID=935616 RepID=A0ABV6NMP9_9BACI|nr:3-hydroxyacyl-ACP dehydratase FabZ [Halalkalibacter alkalisediminis]